MGFADGGPESEEGQEGPFQERKEGEQREVHGKAGVERKQFVLGRDQSPRKWWQRKQERELKPCSDKPRRQVKGQLWN